MKNAIGGLFKQKTQADQASQALQEAGFSSQDISLWVHKKSVPLNEERRVSPLEIGLSALIGNTVFDVKPPSQKGGDFTLVARGYAGQRKLSADERKALAKGIEAQLKSREVKVIAGEEVPPKGTALMRWIFTASAQPIRAFLKQLKAPAAT